MRTKLVAGNWKMNLTATESSAVVEAFVGLVDQRLDVDVVLCPPYLSIHRVRELIRRTHIKLGAQDVFWKENGAFTGQVSPTMLRDEGVAFCIVGHSETRGKFGKLEVPESALGFFSETDETVNLKLKALLYHSIVPILCVGETLAEREAGQTDQVIRTQLERALDGIDSAEMGASVVAYEPVWAIGTGQTCDAEEANRVCGMIRNCLGEVCDADTAAMVRILYGGSVKASNSAQIFSQPEIDGGLVGGASLDPREFSLIVLSA
ncbi:MAG TPA: triose-phosphate isomerase [Fimbriimonas sp.]